MCIVPMMLGNALGGRTGAMVGGALGGGVPGLFAASKLFGKKNNQTTGQPTTGQVTGG